MNEQSILVRVKHIKNVAPTIREFTLVAHDESALPPFSAGSHILVTMKQDQSTWRNAYSLVGDPNELSHYKIALRKQEQSRGGSVFMHESVREGDLLSIKPPTNLFALYRAAKKHILIAGGVGVTPFMSYLAQLKQLPAEVEMHYMFHSSKTGAYQQALQAQLGENLLRYDSDKGVRCNLDDIFADQLVGTHVYVCGPQSLIDGVLSSAESFGWPRQAIHYETFKTSEPGKPFDITLKRSGIQLHVTEDSSLLETLETAEVAIESSCRGGVCGRCLTSVLDGEIEHHDEFLSAEEKAAQDCLMPCVSRAAGQSLVLDL